MSKENERQEKPRLSQKERDVLTKHMNSQLKSVRNEYTDHDKEKWNTYRLFGVIIAAAVILSVIITIVRSLQG